MKRRKNFIPITVDNKQFLYNISGTKLIYYDSSDRKFELELTIPVNSTSWRGKHAHRFFDKKDIAEVIHNDLCRNN